MSVAHVHDWQFKPDGDIDEGIASMVEYVDFLKANVPGLEISLWLKDQENPLRYFHIAVFDSEDSLEMASDSQGTERFVNRLYPEIDESTHTYPTCNVFLSSGGNLRVTKP